MESRYFMVPSDTIEGSWDIYEKGEIGVLEYGLASLLITLDNKELAYKVIQVLIEQEAKHD